jgi:hypothetical protein
MMAGHHFHARNKVVSEHAVLGAVLLNKISLSLFLVLSFVNHANSLLAISFNLFTAFMRFSTDSK